MVHNFIRIHDPLDGNDDEDWPEILPATRSDLHGQVSRRERTDASDRRDRIAQDMWDDYLQYIR